MSVGGKAGSRRKEKKLMKMRIDEITIPTRIRKDMGDLKELMESIRTKGLINAITITEDKVLIAGERRIRACQLLGMDEVKVDVIDVEDL